MGTLKRYWPLLAVALGVLFFRNVILEAMPVSVRKHFGA